MKNIILIIAFSAFSQHLRAVTVQIWQELPYLGTQDSPFYAGIQAGSIYLEDFEDHNLNTPYAVSWDYPRVYANTPLGPVLSDQFGYPISTLGYPLGVRSVDADDGLLGDYRGLNGDSWTTNNGRIEFRFERDEQGRLPTYVGFVVTEPWYSDDDVEIGAWDDAPGNGNLGNNWWNDEVYDPMTWTPNEHNGDTRAHRFFGIYSDTGILGIVARNVRQLDHLQYGYAIPEPCASAWLILSPLFLLRRKRGC